MTLTLDRLHDHIFDALDREPSSTNSPELLVNEAGVAWCNANGWRYLRRKRKSLELVIGQSIYGLGEDFRELVSITDTAYPALGVDLVTITELEEIRSLAYSAPNAYCATVYDGSVGGVSQSVLELFPVPAAARAFTLIYRGGWAPVDQQNDTIELPPHLEPPFVEWVRTYAEAREKKLKMPEVIALCKASPIFQDAAARDGSELPYKMPEMGNVGHRYATRGFGSDIVVGPSGLRWRRPWGG